MRPPDSPEVLCEVTQSGKLEHSYASATRMAAPSEDCFGGNGGIGQPSATRVAAPSEDCFGGNGGMGQPSALRVRSIVMGLPAERLTDRTIGGTIKTVRTRTATAIAVFFKGGPS